MHTTGQTPEVQTFINDLRDTDTEQFEIVVELYSLFSSVSSTFTDKFIYGGIGIYIEDILTGGIYVSKKHVSLVFSDGYLMQDKHNVFEGSGKYRRHIKLHTVKEIKEKQCLEYIQQLFAQ